MRPPHRPSATWLISANLLLVPLVASADEDLPAKREACRTEARQQIKPRSGTSAGLYEITLRARERHVRQCMARAPEDWVTTGSLGSKPIPPLPPRRPTGALKE